jgi:FAD/FMN-containing dehydrogenase
MTATASAATLLRDLEQLLGPVGLVRDPGRLRTLGQDFLRGSRGFGAGSQPVTPIVAVRPRSTDEVAAVVRVAAAAGVPMVERGGGTGLMGGARAVQPGIVLDFDRMNRVIEVRPRDLAVHVQAGAVLADIGAALEPYGLIVGHDPWTYPVATVGGTISTNGLGYLGGKYGAMGDQVLGLTAVLADGTVMHTRAVPRSSTGPRLNRLFAGAEGTLGVITEAVLQVFPSPEERGISGFRFPGFEEGFRAVEAMHAAGIRPALVDFGQTYRGSREGRGVVTPDGAPGVLYLVFDGLREEVRALQRRSAAILVEHGARRRPREEAEEFWQDRHVIAEQIRARRERGENEQSWSDFPGPVFDYIHVALPASQVLTFKERCRPIFLDRGISIAEWGLWHQPELFSVAFFRYAERESEIGELAAASEEALRLVQELGGSMEYVHGAGLRLAHLMESEHGRGQQVLRYIKHSLDPAGLLNPGKLGL